MLKLVNVGKIYNTNGNVAVGIRKVNLELHSGEFVAITGESGAGKTTLLNILSGIDSYEEGEMYVNGEETSYFSSEDLENYRNKYVGFIFQNYNIIDSYNVLQNVEAALLFVGYPKDKRRERALDLIKRVGLEKEIKTKASKLSGGEKQRAVIARALAKDAPIIAADEPTGNLDSQSSKEIIELLHEVSKDKLVLIVTHDFNEVADYATRIIRVFDNEIKEDRILKADNEIKDLPSISDENKKASMKDILSLSFVDLFGSPKRLIFHTIIFFIMSLFVLLSVALYRTIVTKSMSDTSLYNSSFSNVDNRRIVVNKKDHTAFSEAELTELKNSSNVKALIPYDYMLESSAYFFLDPSNEDYYYSFTTFLVSSSTDLIKESDLECGRMPKASGEICLNVKKENFVADGINSYEGFLGQKLSSSSLIFEMTVVGIINGDKTLEGENNYSVIYQSDFESMRISRYFMNYVSIDIYGASAYIKMVKSSNSLTNTEFAYSGEVMESEKGIKISDAYGDVLNEPDLKAKTISDMESDVLYLSPDVYDKCFTHINNIYQVSLIALNGYKVDSIVNHLPSSYRTIVPLKIASSTNIVDTISVVLYLSFMVQFLVATFFIVYATLLHSIKARREDIEILRTIGATKGNIRTMLEMEYLTIGTFSYVLILIAFFIVKAFVTDRTLVLAMSSLTFLDFLSVLIMIIIMSFLLSLLFTRSIFKKTIKKGLDQK